MRFSFRMKSLILAFAVLATISGLIAKPLIFTFSEYQVDPATYPDVDPANYSNNRTYPLALLADLKPIASQSVELSSEGNGKAVATIGDSTVTLEVRAVPNKESRYDISVKHEFVSAYAGDSPIISSRGNTTGGTFKVGDERVVGSSKIGVDEDVQAYVTVVKLTD